jgi:hypothetical protein
MVTKTDPTKESCEFEVPYLQYWVRRGSIPVSWDDNLISAICHSISVSFLYYLSTSSFMRLIHLSFLPEYESNKQQICSCCDEWHVAWVHMSSTSWVAELFPEPWHFAYSLVYSGAYTWLMSTGCLCISGACIIARIFEYVRYGVKGNWRFLTRLKVCRTLQSTVEHWQDL